MAAFIFLLMAYVVARVHWLRKNKKPEVSNVEQGTEDKTVKNWSNPTLRDNIFSKVSVACWKMLLSVSLAYVVADSFSSFFPLGSCRSQRSHRDGSQIYNSIIVIWKWIDVDAGRIHTYCQRKSLKAQFTVWWSESASWHGSWNRRAGQIARRENVLNVHGRMISHGSPIYQAQQASIKQ